MSPRLYVAFTGRLRGYSVREGSVDRGAFRWTTISRHFTYQGACRRLRRELIARRMTQ